jgi:hypothetical protein
MYSSFCLSWVCMYVDEIGMCLECGLLIIQSPQNALMFCCWVTKHLLILSVWWSWEEKGHGKELVGKIHPLLWALGNKWICKFEIGGVGSLCLYFPFLSLHLQFKRLEIRSQCQSYWLSYSALETGPTKVPHWVRGMVVLWSSWLPWVYYQSFTDNNCFMQSRAKALSDLQQMQQVQVVNKISPPWQEHLLHLL